MQDQVLNQAANQMKVKKFSTAIRFPIFGGEIIKYEIFKDCMLNFAVLLE